MNTRPGARAALIAALIFFASFAAPYSAYALLPTTTSVAPTLSNQTILQILSGVLTSFSQLLSELPGKVQTYTPQQQIAAEGNTAVPYAAENAINQLSGVTITNANLTASEIPSLDYLPLSGGTVTGDLIVNGSFSGGSLSLSTASTSNLVATNVTTTSLTVTGTSTLAGINLSNSNCSTFGNGGKLTTDAFGNVVCEADQGGSGSTVAGANTQVQFNDAGGFGANAAFTFDKANTRLTITNASTTNISASGNSSLGNATSTSLFSTLANFTTAIANTFTVSVANIVGLTATNATTTNIVATNATSTNLYAASAVIPSLSATNASFSTATTSNLSVTGVASSLLKTTSIGSVVPAIAGTDYVASTGGDWTGTFGTHAPSFYLDARNLTNFTTPFATALHATTTDALSEGATNLYFTNNRVASVIAGTTTDALAEGTTNKYFTNARAQNAIAVSGSPLTYASGVIGINQASGSVNGFLTSSDWTSFNSKIASTSLSGTAPITYNSSTGAIGFDFTHGNTWTGGQAFTNVTVTNATTSSLYITGITSKLLKTDANGQVAAANAGTDYQAPITSGNLTTGANLSVSGGTGAVIGSGTSISLGSNVVTGVTNDTNVTGSIAGNNLTLGWTGLLGALRGGTGSSTLSGILKGNGTGPILSAVGGTDYEFPLTFSSPLSRAGNAISFLFNTANTWTGLNQFQNGASTTRLSTYGPAYFGATATSSFDTGGNLNLVSNGLSVGTNQLVVSGGKVGIGTTTPFALLSVSGGDTRLKETVDSPTALVVENAAGTATLQVSTLDSSGNIFEIASSTGTAYLDVTTAGNVGVGSTTPSATFGLVGSHYLTGGLGVGTLNTNAGSIVATATTTALNYIASGLGAAGAPAFTFSGNANTGLWSPSANALAWSTNGSERIRLDASGNFGIGTTTPGSIFSINGVANWTGATSTIYSTGGINLSGGCFAINGTCVTGGGGGGSVTSITAGTGLTGGTITTSGTIALDLTRANTWTGLQTFNAGFVSQASSTAVGNFTITGTASTTNLTISGLGNTSTNCLQINNLGVVSSAGSACGGSGSTPGGSNGQLQFNNSGAFGASSNLFWDNTNGRLGVGTSTPFARFAVSANSGDLNPYILEVSSSTPSATTSLFRIDNAGNSIFTLASSTFSVGANGVTNPAFQIFASTTNAATGLALTSNLAGNGVGLAVTSSGATESLTINSKGGSNLNIGPSGNGSLNLMNNGIIRTVINSSFSITNLSPGFTNAAAFAMTGTATAGRGAGVETPLVNWTLPLETHNNGALSLNRSYIINAPTEAFTSYSTSNNFTDLATFSVNSAPLTPTSGNGTTTNAYAILVGSSTASTMFNASTTNSYGLAVFTSAGARNTYSAIFNGGNVGIGTTSPWRTLAVTGTVGFDGLTGTTGAGSLCLDSNKQVVYNSGSDNCLSSLRATKHDIQPLDLTALNMVKSLQPVAFIYNNDASSTVRYGFIAEDTASVDSHLATYDANGAISGVDDRALLAIVTEAVQSLIDKLSAFAESFTTKELTFTRATGDEVDAKKLCLQKSDGTNVCVTGDQLAAAISEANTSASTSGASTPSPDATPPVIHINGENPAHINVGDAYSDLGATITGPEADLNLGIKTFLNGTLTSNIMLDTSAAATNTIDYVASDQNGLTSTSSRTVIIEPVAFDSNAAVSATTTLATTTQSL